VDWGSVSSWVAAVGTSASLLIAVSVARRQVKDAHRAQASEIHGWIALSDEPGREGVRCAVLNGSGHPAYDVRLHVVNPSLEEVGAVDFGMALPREQAERHFETPLSLGEWHSWIEFTDGAGTAWLRDASGRLREARQTSPTRLQR
jgi:hypothetical protein